MVNICLIYFYFMLFFSVLFFTFSIYFVILDYTIFYELNLLLINSTCILMTFFIWLNDIFIYEICFIYFYNIINYESKFN